MVPKGVLLLIKSWLTWSIRLRTETYCSSVDRSSQAILCASLIRPVQCLDNSTMLLAADLSSRFSWRIGFESSPSSSIPASSDVVYEMSESSDGTALIRRAGFPVLRFPFRTMLEFLKRMFAEGFALHSEDETTVEDDDEAGELHEGEPPRPESKICKIILWQCHFKSTHTNDFTSEEIFVYNQEKDDIVNHFRKCL